MRRTLAATATVLAALTLAGCSDGSSSPKPSASPSRSGSGFNAAGYLYHLEGDKHSRSQIAALLAGLDRRCKDDVGVLTAAATNAAVRVTDAKGTQTTYGVLEKLAAGLPASGKVSCQGRLLGVEKQLKASR